MHFRACCRAVRCIYLTSIFWSKSLQNYECIFSAEISAELCMQNFGRHLTCGMLAAISTECCVQNFERNLPIILHVEFRTKSPQNPACRIHAKLSPGFHIHNFGRNFSRIVYAAELCMQIFGRNLPIILHAEFRTKSSESRMQSSGRTLCGILHAQFRTKSQQNCVCCRILHAEFRTKSPHNAACRILAEMSADLRPKSPHNSVCGISAEVIDLQNYACRISAEISA